MTCTRSQSLEPLRPAGTPAAMLDELVPQVLDLLPLGLVVFDQRCLITYRNAAADLLLHDADNLAKALFDNADDSVDEEWRAALAGVISDRRQHRFPPVVLRPSSGDERHVHMTAMPLITESGRVDAGLLIIEDVTDRAVLEHRLAVAEPMAAVGNLTARVAHELNNPLDGILRYVNLAIRGVQTGQTDRLADYLTHARNGINRMLDIVRELAEFSRRAHTVSNDAGINAAIQEAIKVMSGRAIASGVTIECRLADQLAVEAPAIRGSSLFQVFCNLVKNAIDAMPDGGTLTILTEVIGSNAIIQFEDTGIGLPTDGDRIFEPFFTTKQPGKGTGLGLAVCKDIVARCGGNITAARRSPEGSVFTIRMPLENRTKALDGNRTKAPDGNHTRALDGNRTKAPD